MKYNLSIVVLAVNALSDEYYTELRKATNNVYAIKLNPACNITPLIEQDKIIIPSDSVYKHINKIIDDYSERVLFLFDCTNITYEQISTLWDKMDEVSTKQKAPVLALQPKVVHGIDNKYILCTGQGLSRGRIINMYSGCLSETITLEQNSSRIFAPSLYCSLWDCSIVDELGKFNEIYNMFYSEVDIAIKAYEKNIHCIGCDIEIPVINDNMYKLSSRNKLSDLNTLYKIQGLVKIEQMNCSDLAFGAKQEPIIGNIKAKHEPIGNLYMIYDGEITESYMRVISLANSLSECGWNIVHANIINDQLMKSADLIYVQLLPFSTIEIMTKMITEKVIEPSKLVYDVSYFGNNVQQIQDKLNGVSTLITTDVLKHSIIPKDFSNIQTLRNRSNDVFRVGILSEDMMFIDYTKINSMTNIQFVVFGPAQFHIPYETEYIGYYNECDMPMYHLAHYVGKNKIDMLILSDHFYNTPQALKYKLIMPTIGVPVFSNRQINKNTFDSKNSLYSICISQKTDVFKNHNAVLNSHILHNILVEKKMQNDERRNSNEEVHNIHAKDNKNKSESANILEICKKYNERKDEANRV